MWVPTPDLHLNSRFRRRNPIFGTHSHPAHRRDPRASRPETALADRERPPPDPIPRNLRDWAMLRGHSKHSLGRA